MPVLGVARALHQMATHPDTESDFEVEAAAVAALDRVGGRARGGPQGGGLRFVTLAAV
jgi:hypothetical protein